MSDKLKSLLTKFSDMAKNSSFVKGNVFDDNIHPPSFCSGSPHLESHYKSTAPHRHKIDNCDVFIFQELEIVLGNEHISFSTAKIGSLIDVNNCK